MIENKSKLICYETRKSTGDQILNDRKNGGFLCEAKFVIADDKMGERLVYHLKSSSVFSGQSASSLSSNSWELTYYTVKEIKRLSPSRVKTEYNTKLVYLGWVDDIESLIRKLIKYYKFGRVLVGKNTWGSLPTAYTRALYYKQVKRILSFENRSRSIVSTDAQCAVRNTDPTLILDRIDFGEYCVEAWGSYKRKNYTYITFSEETKKWLDKICHQVTV